jgi:hypothetical protein
MNRQRQSIVETASQDLPHLLVLDEESQYICQRRRRRVLCTFPSDWDMIAMTNPLSLPLTSRPQENLIRHPQSRLPIQDTAQLGQPISITVVTTTISPRRSRLPIVHLDCEAVVEEADVMLLASLETRFMLRLRCIKCRD